MSAQTQPNRSQKLLVANRGEIAVRILRTARRLQIPTLAIYTHCDATSPHVTLADEAIPLRPNDADPASNARGYTDIEEIVRICVEYDVTLVHPGYGFLSENADFALALQEKGIGWVGPRPDIVRRMGLKHEARRIAEQAGVPVVPGSGDTLLQDADQAVKVADAIGYPVLLKATAGGGGMGMAVCTSEEDVNVKFDSTRDRAVSLFHNGGIFVERYIVSARHVEVQVFGDGRGRVIHMGERECSIQRRHQKVIEEAPSPFMATHLDIRDKLCQAAVDLCASINYNSAGTVEFIVDDVTREFFFLEMNTRIQVEHTVTEAICPGLDIVELMLQEATADQSISSHSLLSDKLDWVQQHFARPVTDAWAIQTRVYCENPTANFKPTPGVLQHVQFPSPMPRWLRVDTWVQKGTTVTPFYDPLVAKIVSVGKTRGEALARTMDALQQCKIWGPPNNMAYLRAVCADTVFRAGRATTAFLSNFEFTPRALDILSGGIETTIQDYPGRKLAMGIPRSGPMDSLSLRIANIVVAIQKNRRSRNYRPSGRCRMFFHVDTVILRGGFAEVAQYLGSKSTSMGLGGYQGRSLTAGDQLTLGTCSPTSTDTASTLPPNLFPSYSFNHWTIYCLSGPTQRRILHNSLRHHRLLLYLLASPKIEWARRERREGGSHPSNIHDNGYALGSVNVNGDTPGPDMGGYVCVCTVASADMWKLGQLRPGDAVQFKCISFDAAQQLASDVSSHLEAIRAFVEAQKMTRDAAILVEYGEPLLDLHIRARVHAFEDALRNLNIPGLWALSPCIRSTMVRFDPTIISQSSLLSALIATENSLPASMHSITFSGRKITFPIALERYMRTTRDEAVYLPSNVEYLARNNGLSDWLVFGVGFYLGCPFLVPVSPHTKIIREGEDFSPDTPWLLEPFDQDSTSFQIESVTFSMADYDAFVASIQPELDEFRQRQAEGVASEEARCAVELWEQRKREERESELAKIAANPSGAEQTESASHITSSINASVWKITQQPGYVIKSPEDVLLVLEAMKTEINVEAGEENEGAMVSPGQILVYLV
ncbi:carbamoyl-phosphate synthase L chain, ATP binding domain-containing protein [Irpex lacteus]|nr:carbamoyl-phosphate synthase L chain, ATP binding domain-containing protein [Irpex lacteus]